jgi:hypothetical protein
MGLGAGAPTGGSRTAMPTPWCRDEGEGIGGDCFLQEEQLQASIRRWRMGLRRAAVTVACLDLICFYTMH